jgi:hypothetical protein
VYEDTGRGFNEWIDNRIVKLLGQTYLQGGYAVTTALGLGDLEKYFVTQQELSDSRGIRVVDPTHPIFANTDVQRDQIIGRDFDIVFNEIDGLPLRGDGSVDRASYPFVSEGVRVIGQGMVFNRNKAGTQYTPYGRTNVTSMITELDHDGGGVVLHFGSIGWYRGVAARDPLIEQVVTNAVQYLINEGQAGVNFELGNELKEFERDIEVGGPVSFPNGGAFDRLIRFQNLRMAASNGDDDAKLSLVIALLRETTPGSETYVEITQELIEAAKRGNQRAHGTISELLSANYNALTINLGLLEVDPYSEIFSSHKILNEAMAARLLGNIRADLDRGFPRALVVQGLFERFLARAEGETITSVGCEIFGKTEESGYIPALLAHAQCVTEQSDLAEPDSINVIDAIYAGISAQDIPNTAKLNQIDAQGRRGVDLELVRKQLIPLANAYDVQAMIRLVDIALIQSANIDELALIRPYLEKLSEAGYGNAKYALAVLLEYGVGGDADLIGAKGLYRVAALSGHGPAQVRYVRHILGSSDAVPDPQVLVDSLSNFESSGSPHAAFALGLLYSYGNSVDLDRNKACEYFVNAGSMASEGAGAATEACSQ